MTEALPAVMVAHLEQLGQELLQITKPHRGASLAVLEQAVLTAVRQAMPVLLSDVINHSVTNLQPAFAPLSQSCPTCGQRVEQHDWRSRTVKTVCGIITYERPWYACKSCEQGFSPTDQTLGLPLRARLSAGLKGWIIESGAEQSFHGAAKEVERLTGIRVSHETVRQHTEACGAALEAKDQQAQAQVVKTQEAAEAVDRAPGQLVVETDGVMVRYLSGWHEVKLGVVGGLVDGELRAVSYIAAREPAEQFGPRLLAEAARRGALEIAGWTGPVTGRGLAQLRPVVILGDGAIWIWNLAGDYFSERIEIIDFYHTSEYIWDLAKALYGEGTEATKDWAEQRLKELRAEGVAPILASLATVKPQTEGAADILRKAQAHFKTNAARMAYPDFEAAGLPIGSGAVESSAKHLVQKRMKLPGARWSDYGGQGVLNVRCHLLSGRSLAA